MKLNADIRGINSLSVSWKDKQKILKKGIKGGLYEIGNSIQEEIKRLIPIKTGKTQRSIKKKVTNSQVSVFSDYEVVKFLEDGTRGHMIFPRSKQALRWKQDGKYRFSKGHFVKGIKARKYFQKTFDKYEKQSKKILYNIIKKLGS